MVLGQHVGVGPIRVIDVEDVVARARNVAQPSQYRDNAALVTMKVPDAANALHVAMPEPGPESEAVTKE